MPAATESPVLPRPYSPRPPPCAPDSAPTSAIHKLSSISMATADQTHPNHPLCKLYVTDFPVDICFICRCPYIVPDPAPLPRNQTRLRIRRGIESSVYGNTARLNHRASPPEKLLSHHPLQCVHPVDLQKCSALPRPTSRAPHPGVS